MPQSCISAMCIFATIASNCTAHISKGGGPCCIFYKRCLMCLILKDTSSRIFFSKTCLNVPCTNWIIDTEMLLLSSPHGHLLLFIIHNALKAVYCTCLCETMAAMQCPSLCHAFYWRDLEIIWTMICCIAHLRGHTRLPERCSGIVHYQMLLWLLKWWCLFTFSLARNTASL